MIINHIGTEISLHSDGLREAKSIRKEQKKLIIAKNIKK